MKYKLLLLIGLVSLMVIVAGCGLTQGESLAGNARATGREAVQKIPVTVNQKVPVMVSQEVPVTVSAGLLKSEGGCYTDVDCASDQYCQGAKNAANLAYSKKGSCVMSCLSWSPFVTMCESAILLNYSTNSCTNKLELYQTIDCTTKNKVCKLVPLYNGEPKLVASCA